MYYYRAALASAYAGNLTSASRLVKCSIMLKEDVPSAAYLLDLLNQNARIETDVMDRLRVLVNASQYKKALKIKLPQTSKAYTIRGLLYAQMGVYRKAANEFAMAITLDKGNDLAGQALRYCIGKKGCFIRELIRTAWN